MVAEAAIETGITCAKCDFVNPRSARNHCRKCGAHLLIACHNCGRGNERVATECTSCGAELRPRGWNQLIGRARRRLGVAGFTVVAVAVLLVVGGLVYLKSAKRDFKLSPIAEKFGSKITSGERP